MKISVKWMFLIGAAMLTGCGGGSGGGGATTTGGSGRAAIFVTDSFREDYDHVWATVYKVELLTATGEAETVFEDGAGKILDLRSLHDATGQRFAFLSEDSVASANYTRARLTLKDNMTLFPQSNPNGTSFPLADGLPRDTQGRVLVTFNLAAPRNLGSGSDDLVIDFDLANFALTGGKITPALKEASRTGLEDSQRHEREDYTGVISSLSGAAPNFTFTLTMGNGIRFTVVTGASTAVFNSNNTPNPLLANGKTVEVTGAFNIAQNRLEASDIKIEDANAPDSPEIKGKPSSIQAGNGTFVVTVVRAEGLVPSQTTINVTTSAATVFRSDSGLTLSAADFFARLGTSALVEVEGDYNAATNTLTAHRAKLEDETHNGGDDNGPGQEAEAKGKPASIQASSGTFSISPVSEFEGFQFSGGALNVVTTAATVFKDNQGNVISRAAFFAALPASAIVQAEGVYASGTLTARNAKIRE